MKPRLSVVVCTYNRYRLLRYCLESLCAQTMDKLLYEVIIVDNNSSDDTQKVASDFIKQYSNMRYLRETNPGTGYCRNKGWLEAAGEYVAFIDDDAKASPQWCERILAAFDGVVPQPEAVGGPIYPWFQSTPPSWISAELETMTWGPDPRFLDLRSSPDRYGFYASNMAFKRSILQSHGGFNVSCGKIGPVVVGLGVEAEFFHRIHNPDSLFWYDSKLVVFHLVSEERIHLRSRFRREFKAAIAVASIDKIGILSFAYFKGWSMLCARIITMPLFLILERRNNPKATFVKIMTRCSSELGYLLGSIRNK